MRSSMRSSLLRPFVLTAAFASGACSAEAPITPASDSGITDTGATDSAVTDTGATDAPPVVTDKRPPPRRGNSPGRRPHPGHDLPVRSGPHRAPTAAETRLTPPPCAGFGRVDAFAPGSTATSTPSRSTSRGSWSAALATTCSSSPRRQLPVRARRCDGRRALAHRPGHAGSAVDAAVRQHQHHRRGQHRRHRPGDQHPLRGGLHQRRGLQFRLNALDVTTGRQRSGYPANIAPPAVGASSFDATTTGQRGALQFDARQGVRPLRRALRRLRHVSRLGGRHRRGQPRRADRLRDAGPGLRHLGPRGDVDGRDGSALRRDGQQHPPRRAHPGLDGRTGDPPRRRRHRAHRVDCHASYFEATDARMLDLQDLDIGSVAPLVLPPIAGAPRMLWQGGKAGVSYLFNRDEPRRSGRQLFQASATSLAATSARRRRGPTARTPSCSRRAEGRAPGCSGSGGVMALRVNGSALATAWCSASVSNPSGRRSRPTATTTACCGSRAPPRRRCARSTSRRGWRSSPTLRPACGSGRPSWSPTAGLRHRRSDGLSSPRDSPRHSPSRALRGARPVR
jgi:hypothetical protein